MALVILCRKICAPRMSFKLNPNVNKQLISMFNTNFNPNKITPILKTKSSVLLTSTRKFFKLFKRPSKQQLQVADNVPDTYTLIYRSTMDRYILLAQLFSAATTLIVFLVTIIKHDLSSQKIKLSSEWSYPSKSIDNELYLYMGAFIGVIVILQMMISHLPIRIYYFPQQRNYIFIFHGHYPFSQKKLSCNIGEVSPLPATGIAPWKEVQYSIKGNQKVFLLDQYFRRSADLYIMLGVQKDHDVHEDNSKT